MLEEQRGVEATIHALESRCATLVGENQQLHTSLSNLGGRCCELEGNLQEAKSELEQSQASAAEALSMAQQLENEKVASQSRAQQLQEALQQLASDAEIKVTQAELRNQSMQTEMQRLVEALNVCEMKTKQAEAKTELLESQLNGQDCGTHEQISLLRLALADAKLQSSAAGMTMIIEAAQGGDVHRLQRLIMPATPSSDENKFLHEPMHCALSKACQAGQRDAVELLLSFGANASGSVQPGPEDNGLHLATGAGHTRVVETLLEFGGCDINSRDARGCTALHIASMTANLSLLQILLHNGAEIDARNSEGLTAVDVAATNVFCSTGERQHSSPHSDSSIAQEAAKKAVIEILTNREACLYNAIHRANFHYDNCNYTTALDHLQHAAALLENEESPELSLSDQARYMLHRNRAHAARKTEPVQHTVVLDGCAKALLLAEARNQTNPELLEMRAFSAMELFDFKQACIDYEVLSEVAARPEDSEQWKICLREATFLRDADHYEVLDIDSDAEPATIKRAFFKLSKVFHPDRHEGSIDGKRRATAFFQRMNEAYTTLSDTHSRQMYDEHLCLQRLESRPAQSQHSYFRTWFTSKFGNISSPPRSAW